MKKNIFFDMLGYFMLLLFGMTVFVHHLSHDLVYLFWFSNHTTLVIGLALLFRSRFWLTAEVALGLLPELLWIVDFVSARFFSYPIFGFTSYLFDPSYPLLQYLLALQHLFVLPLAIIALWFMHPQRGSYGGAFLHGVLLWFSGYLLRPQLNINCSYHACISFFEHKAYLLFWPFLALGIIWLVYRILLWMDFSQKECTGKGH